MIFLKRKFKVILIFSIASLPFIACENNDAIDSPQVAQNEASSEASYPELASFKSSSSSSEGQVYEVLPGPAALDNSQSPTPFSNNIRIAAGSYAYTIEDNSPDDSEGSEDAVTSVDINFACNGITYKIDQIDVIHKAEGTGEHTYFGGTATNKVIHGNTGVGTDLEPKLLAYITLWGVADLKNADTGEVIAANRMIHVMTTTGVRNENLELITSREVDSTDYNFRSATTHVIMPPMDLEGNRDPIPGTPHGFLHMMFGQVNLEGADRDPSLAYEILPGPSAIDPSTNPTPFSNRIAYGAGTYSYTVADITENDSEGSMDGMKNFQARYERPDGTVFVIDNVKLIHKAEGTGEHTFFGGTGLDRTIHGNTGVGTNLEPKLLAYITSWGTADLKDGDGNLLASNRMIHVMTTSKVRTDNLELITDRETDRTDHSLDKVETHIIVPPMDLDGNMSPVPGSGHGFLHLMFEEVSLGN